MGYNLKEIIKNQDFVWFKIVNFGKFKTTKSQNVKL